MSEKKVIERVIKFLTMFMPVTLATRVVCVIMLSSGVSKERTAELTGFCDKTVRKIQKNLNEENMDDIFVINGGGRKSKISDVEKEIIEEIDSNQYHSRQQIADMILEKFGIKLCVRAVGNFLKKTPLKD
ncbi:MAG: hypothetical protein LBS21_10280 [Clostridiales bacterium]|jgi:transposase|nr:hypothetical protein [Clostridiales bacterium]